MRKLFSVFVFFWILSGCSSSWHIQRAQQKCPDCFTTSVKVEYKDSIVYRDTLIELSLNDFIEIDTTPEIRYEKEYINNKIYVLPSFDTIIKEERGLTAFIWLKKGGLKARFIIDSTLIYNYKDSIHVLNKIITEKNNTLIKKSYSIKEIVLLIGFVCFALLIIVIVLRAYHSRD